MNSPIAQPSPQTAPRDLAALIRGGRFMIRKLADQLGLIPTEEQAMAFMGLPTDKQAEAVLVALKNYDAANGGPPPQAMQQQPQAMPPAQPQQVAQPMQQPAPAGFGGFQPPQGFQPTQQAAQPAFQPPQGFAPPQQQAQAPEQAPAAAPATNGAPALGGGLGGGLRRSPVNNGVPTNGAAAHGHTPPAAALPQQPPAGEPAGPAAPAPGVDLTAVMQSLANIEAKLAAKEKKGEGIKEVLDEIEFLRKLLAFNFTASILVIESLNPGTGRDAIFQAILNDTPLLQDALAPHLSSGKGKKGK